MRPQSILLLAAAAMLVLLAGCGNKEPQTAAPAEQSGPPPVEPSSQAAPSSAPAPLATQKPAASTSVKPAAPTPHPITMPKPAPVVFVPAGTVLPLSLSTALGSRNAKVGDPVSAALTSDVMVDGKTVIAAGTTVAGSVIKVVSGSDKIGGTPTLAISFERLELPGGTDIPISGEITQQGKSDTARDTVKIVGGTAAGAIIGDKVIKGKKGKVIGGLLGGAVGAVAAQKTGTEVQLQQGTAMSLTLDAPVEITK